LVKTCLAKDPEERWQTAHDVKLQLQWIAEGGSPSGPRTVRYRGGRRGGGHSRAERRSVSDEP